MEKQTEILVICAHEGIMSVMLRLIKSNAEWNATGAGSAGEGKQFLAKNNYQLVLLGNGLTGDEEAELKALCRSKNIKAVTHFGGGSGLLFGEIYEALSSKPQ